MDDKSRRDFLRGGWKLGGALLIGAAAYTGYEALRPLATGAGGAKITVGTTSSFADRTRARTCPRAACTSSTRTTTSSRSRRSARTSAATCPFCESSGRFECPCHGSIYDLAGEYITGPAPRGMDRYEVTLDGDNVVVDTSVAEGRPGPRRQALPHAAQGPELHREGLTCRANARSRRRSSPSGSNAA